MSDHPTPSIHERPTGPETTGMGGVSSGPAPAAAVPPARTVLARGERVPWPRRLIATGILAAVLALALHALPRPYQSIPTGVVRELGDAYGNLRYTYRNDVPALEPVAGEASAEERAAYARELWRYRWFGSFREILLRFSEWLAASCMVIALALIVVERRRTAREMKQRGAVTGPTVLRHETLAGDPLAPSPAVQEQMPMPAPPPVFPEDATPPFPTAKPKSLLAPVRETGDEVTPPSPTPVPPQVPGALELRPSPFEDDDDLARTTENQVANLAKRAAPMPAPAATAAPAASALPVFFAERRHPETHPVVHPGDAAPPAEPAPTPPPVSSREVAAAAPPAGSANDNPGWWPKPGSGT